MGDKPRPLSELPLSDQQQVAFFQRHVRSYSPTSILVSAADQDYELVTDLVYAYPDIPTLQLQNVRYRFEIQIDWEEAILCVICDKRLEVSVDSAAFTSQRLLWWDKSSKARYEVGYHQVDMAFPLLDFPKRGLKILGKGDTPERFIPLYVHDALIEALASFLCGASRLSAATVLDLNKATLSQLLTLPFLSEEKAKKLIQFREDQQGFINMRQVGEVLALHPQEVAWLERKGEVTVRPFVPQKPKGRRVDY